MPGLNLGRDTEVFVVSLIYSRYSEIVPETRPQSRFIFSFVIQPAAKSVELSSLCHWSQFSYSPVLVNCNQWGDEVGKEGSKQKAQSRRSEPVLWHQMTAKNTGPKYIDRQNIWIWHSHCNATEKYCSTGTSRLVLHLRQANTHPTLPAFLTYLLNLPALPSISITSQSFMKVGNQHTIREK